jgi:sporulation protein YlmC with PRC-barrel domain
MATQEIHLELLLGKQVLDSTGKPIGRLEEVRAKQQGNEWVIQEYLIGPTALLERLSAWTIGLGVLHLLGARKIHGGYQVPWDKLDLSDPQHPRLCCTLQELKTFDRSR